MFVSERALFVRVALDASGVAAGCEPGLLGFESTVRVVTIAAAHRAFQHLVMERRRKLRLDFIVTADAKLWIVRPQHARSREARLFGVRRRHQLVRAGQVFTLFVRVRRVAVGATDVIAPVLSAAEVVPLFFTGVTRETSLGNFLRRFVREGDDLCFVTTTINVGFAWAMA